MKQTKFRVQRDADNKWLYFTTEQLHAGDSHGVVVAGHTWCLSTNIKNKDGVEIFAGDWLRDKHGKTALVKWWDNNVQFIAVDSFEVTNNGLECCEPAYEFDESGGWIDAEVIGNLFDNPELLEQSDEN